MRNNEHGAINMMLGHQLFHHALLRSRIECGSRFVEQQRATYEVVQAEEKFDQRGFSGTGGTGNAHDLAASHFKRKRADGGFLVVTKNGVTKMDTLPVGRELSIT